MRRLLLFALALAAMTSLAVADVGKPVAPARKPAPPPAPAAPAFNAAPYERAYLDLAVRNAMGPLYGATAQIEAMRPDYDAIGAARDGISFEQYVLNRAATMLRGGNGE